MSREEGAREGKRVRTFVRFGDFMGSLRSLRISSGEWVHALDVTFPGDVNRFDPDPCLSVVLKSRSPVLRPRVPRPRLLPGGKA